MAESSVNPGRPRPPKGLRARSKSWWKQVVSAYQLRPDELLLLERACKTLDRIDELEEAMAGEPLLTKGSMGQMRENPLLSEARMQNTLLNRTLAQLNLPDVEAPAQTNRHRAAAQSRWSQHSQAWKYGQ